MRISTSQIYDAGALGIQRNQQGLFTLQNQLSTGRRVLTPEDDPVAAAQALIVTQSKDMVGQHVENQGYARSQLGVLEGNLTMMSNMMLSIIERVNDARNTTYSDAERGYIAREIQNRLDELINLANVDDGTGQFLFAGYQGETRPFAIDGSAAPLPPATQPPVRYFGDPGERLVQVSTSRQMATNVSGAEVFMNIRAGNGTFVTGADAANQGTGVIDAGSVLHPANWQTALAANANGFSIRFENGGADYRIYDGANNPITGALSFSPGQSILLPGGVTGSASVVIKGQPADGDAFTIDPSTNQSIFQTLQNLVGAISTPVNAAYSMTALENHLAAGLANLDQAFENLGRIQADVGSRQKELDFLSDGAADLDLQYAATLSDLQDLDYTAAISKFTQQQIQLEAAQKSFAQISGLSLFNIL